MPQGRGDGRAHPDRGWRREAGGVYRPLLLAALLLAQSPLVARGFSYTPVAGPPYVSQAASLGYPSAATRAAAPAAAQQQAFGPTPASVVVSCALPNFGVAPANAYSDGYVGFVQPMLPTLAAALATLPAGSLLPLQSGDLDGFLVQTLQSLAQTAGFTLRFTFFTPPVSLLPPLNNATDPVLMYAFAALNQTCVIWPTPSSPNRRIYMRQTIPIITFGYQVITTRPSYRMPTLVERMFYWTRPFSTGVWLLMAASVLASALIMPLFEFTAGSASDDFGSSDLHSRGERAGHAVFLASMMPSNYGAFSPTTAAGRVASALHAFSALLIMSSYTANLAAKMTTSQAPTQAVTGVSSFSSDLPLCMRSSSTALTLLNDTFPQVAATVLSANVYGVSTYGTRDALDAVVAGSCAGALVPATEASWVMNVNDTEGALCPLIPVAAPVGEEGVSLTFAVPGLHGGALTDAQLEALNVAISDLHRSGVFLLSLRAQYFPDPPRAVCAAMDAADAAADAALQPAAQLDAVDLAGAFLLQALGIALGVAFHLTKAVRRRWLPISQPLASVGQGINGAAAPAAQLSGKQPAQLAPAPALLPIAMAPSAQQGRRVPSAPPSTSSRGGRSAAASGAVLPPWNLDGGVAVATPRAPSLAGSVVGSQQRAPRREAPPPPPPASEPSYIGNPCWPPPFT